jgi:predicted amidohydrolase YtcJ
MKIKLLIIAVAIATLFSCNNASTKSGINKAQIDSTKTIYYGGDIITMEGDKPKYAEAVVQENDKIVFVGKKDKALKQYPNALQYDLKGHTMLPAFIDPHSHFMSAIRMVNQVNVASPPVGTATDIDDIMKLLVDFKERKNIKDGEWIVGWGYDQDLLKEKRHITKLDIDKYLPNNKVLIIHVSMHGAVLNSKALEWAKLDANSVTPKGGIIARLPNSNEPAGLVMEMAYIPIFYKMPQPSIDEMMTLMKPAQMMYTSNGYVQAVEGFSHISDMDLLLKAARENLLFIDIVSLPGFTEMKGWLNNPKYKFGVYKNHLKFGGAKFVLDGSPQGKTALMCTPYLSGGPNGEKNWYGNSSIECEALAQMVKKMVDNNIQMSFHANGCAAIDNAIYAIKKAGIKAGDNKRPIIIHSQFQTLKQLDEYVKLGISPSYFSNHTFFWGDVHTENMGIEVASFISPLNTAKKKGIITSNHTDFNVTPLNPFFVIWTATNRITRKGVVLGKKERIDTYNALTDITTGPAWQFFEENRKGKIKEGLLADFVILKKNPLKQEIADLKNNEVITTIKEGKIVFEK